MEKTQPTAAEVWVEIAKDRFPECLKQIKTKGPEGCAHLAAEQADALLAEFTKRFGEQP
jgi:hypothetical protein